MGTEEACNAGWISCDILPEKYKYCELIILSKKNSWITKYDLFQGTFDQIFGFFPFEIIGNNHTGWDKKNRFKKFYPKFWIYLPRVNKELFDTIT